MSKIKTFEETKRVSEVKGFLGYKVKRTGIMQQIINMELQGKKYKKLTAKRLDLILQHIKQVTCDYEHNYPITKMLQNDK